MSNTINWGKIQGLSWSPETNLTGTAAAPSFSNLKSISLDGVDDFVTMGNVLNMADDGTDSFSCSFWMKRNSFSTESIVSKQLNSGSYNGLLIYIAAGRLNFFLGSGTSPNSNITGRSTNYVIGSTWTNVIVTYDGSQDISGFNIYINGVSDSVVTISNNTPTKVSNTTDFQLSGRAGGTSLVYGGGLDEVAFWNGTELTSVQANDIYNSGVPNDISSLSPLSWWRCGDGDTAPTLTDNGSGGNNGTMTNFSTFSTDVPTAPSFTNTKSIALDGVDDRIECSSLTTYDNSDFSVSIWIKKTTSGLEYVISNSSSSSKAGFDIIINSLKVNFQRRTRTKQAATGYITIGFTYNTWHNLIGTYNDTTGDLKLYLDSVLKNTSTTSSDVNSASVDLRIGCSTSNGLPFQGGIDEVSIFNSELSASEVTSIYNSGVPNDISSLSPLSWWRCGDGDTAPTLTDNGSGGNNGTMTNFTTFSTDVQT
jgi:hypothetical protein